MSEIARTSQLISRWKRQKTRIVKPFFTAMQYIGTWNSCTIVKDQNIILYVSFTLGGDSVCTASRSIRDAFWMTILGTFWTGVNPLARGCGRGRDCWIQHFCVDPHLQRAPHPPRGGGIFRDAFLLGDPSWPIEQTVLHKPSFGPHSLRQGTES